MNKLAKIMLISLSAFIVGYVYLKCCPISVEVLVAKDEVKIEAAAIQKNIPQKENQISNQVSLKHAQTESQINESASWHSRIEKEAMLINQDWHELMKYHLSSINEAKAEVLFNQYMEETAEFNRVALVLSRKLASLTSEDEDEELYQKNEKLIDKTVQQLSKQQGNHKTKIKKIFGSYYTQLFEVHKIYVQGLPNQEWKWNDFGFTDDD